MKRIVLVFICALCASVGPRVSGATAQTAFPATATFLVHPNSKVALEKVVAEGRRLHDAKVPADGDGELKVSDTSDTSDTPGSDRRPDRGQTPARNYRNAVLALWAQGKPAFGIYAPNENAGPRGQGPRRAVYTREGGEKLAMNPLYDFVFLNLEGAYDADAVKVIAEGLRSANAAGRKTLIVRIPSIEAAGADVTKARVKEVFDVGGDGVTIPHVRGIDEAKQAIAFFQDAKADVWSPSNPNGEKLAMLMLEDPGAVAQVREIADLKTFSILACGIGSLTQALGGDRAGAEAATQKVLAETMRAKLGNMLTFTAQDAEKRVKEGFPALLTQGPAADEAIKVGRAAAGR